MQAAGLLGELGKRKGKIILLNARFQNFKMKRNFISAMDKLSFVALLIHPTSINQNSNELATREIDFVTAIQVVSETTLSSQVLISSVRGILIYLSQNVAGHGIHMVAQM